MISQLLAAIPFPSLDPIIFRIGPVAVRWYGLAYVLGFLLAYVALRRMVQRGDLWISRDQLSSLVNWLVAGVIVGGRAGWWLFYHRGTGATDAWYEPLAIWNGGMSFHGGLAGVATVLVLWSWWQRASLWNLADALALVAPIGLFLGRIANFINAELVGRPTRLPWGVIFPGETIARHPSQLYEAVLEGPLLLAALWLVWRLAQPHPGRIASLFLILYGLIRFLVEFTRQPDEQLGFIAFGWLTMGQALSLALIAAGVLLVWVNRGQPPQPLNPSSSPRRSYGGRTANPVIRSKRPDEGIPS